MPVQRGILARDLARLAGPFPRFSSIARWRRAPTLLDANVSEFLTNHAAQLPREFACLFFFVRNEQCEIDVRWVTLRGPFELTKEF